ncbi:MAG: LytR C-terminal domain-containing protein [Candidatus Roizmanbacteria bacterium]|nr:LytR C-terminal domain-containing protein [Candidatus Roizmanbacteria bacterium]
MIIISLLHNRLQIASSTSSFLGKKQELHASVNIPIDKAENFDIDIWALYLKKLLEESGLPKMRKLRAQVILAERFFNFARLDIPLDIAPETMDDYVEKQLHTLFPDLSSADSHRYFLSTVRGKTTASVYVLTGQNKQTVSTLLDFFDIDIQAFYPESLLLFETFNHTLNTTKKEHVFFLEYEPQTSTGLYFDAYGLVENAVQIISSADIEKDLKTLNKSANKPTRLILSGAKSLDIRQDSFTKTIGIWTNPLHRILTDSPLLITAQQHLLEESLVTFSREIVLLSHLEKKTSHAIAIIPTQKVQKSQHIRIRSNIHIKKILTIAVLLFFSAGLSFFVLRIALTHPITLSVPTVKIPMLFSKKPTATPKPLPTTVPKNSPTPSVSAKDIPIILENGEGSAGLANTYKVRLEEKGYTITRLDNADNYEYTKTVIQTNSKEAFDRIAKDLSSYLSDKPTYEKVTSSTTTIILGADSK